MYNLSCLLKLKAEFEDSMNSTSQFLLSEQDSTCLEVDSILQALTLVFVDGILTRGG